MAERKEIPRRYMMATTAIHMLGDISSCTPDLCEVYAEEGDDYIGRWITGFGFTGVKFPKSTTRELTPEERDKFDGTVVHVNDVPQPAIRTKAETADGTTPTMVTCQVFSGCRCSICGGFFADGDDVCSGSHRIGEQYPKPKGR